MYVGNKWVLTMVLAALSTVSATAAAETWEVGIFAGQQIYRNGTSMGLKTKVDSQSVGALRLGYSLADVGPALLQVTGTYQPESNSPIKTTGINGITTSTSDLKYSSMAVGAMFNFKVGFALGAGVELRSERLKTMSDNLTYNRPWARANIGYSLPSPILKPFVGLEVAVPLQKSSGDGLKPLAPKYQAGVYGGIRF